MKSENEITKELHLHHRTVASIVNRFISRLRQIKLEYGAGEDEIVQALTDIMQDGERRRTWLEICRSKKSGPNLRTNVL